MNEMMVRSAGRFWRQMCGALLICASNLVCAQSARQAASAQTQEPTVLAGAATAAGIRRCYSAIDAVSRRMFAGASRADVMLDWDRANPDGSPFFSLSGMDFRRDAALLSLTTAPAATGGCAILVERISSAPTACTEVARTDLAGYRATSLVRAVTVYTNPARPRETITLVDAPPSCLVLRRQVEFNWPAAR
ncbi:hypothetical protein [Burkholderia cepacia]|uniref:hypothetical protein n=1 Tax=Burkholderia cepacia TaxID=292 RepID=UPI0012D48FE3|nr:hypothetical protein [Burkholderia cepacia]